MDVVTRIRERRVVAVLRRVVDAEAVVDAIAGAGVAIVEVTLDGDGVLGHIETLAARPGVTVLAGTVRSPEQVDEAVAAGAAAVVCPSFSGAVVARAHHHAIPVIPGALTPAEIEAAWRAGAAMVKLFPARLGGPQYVADVLKPLSDIPLLCTGGVTAENAADYLAAGAAAVGVSFHSATTAADEAVRVLAAVAG
jgi:2-dehydro-3-deoxyphosphogluconate aldolase/(4S)-4-hydroxy-2-oxoglutarate aldolase